MVTTLRQLQEVAPERLGEAVLRDIGAIDSWTEFPGPIGPLYVAWGREGVTSVERADDAADFEARYTERWGRPVHRASELPPRLAGQLRRRLAGERTPGPPVDLSGLTGFEQAVLRKTMEIPYGEVRPYAWVAREIDRPRAVRAVGTALANNPVTFVIPCHRVVRADGHIGAYGAGGPSAKRAVLGREGLDVGELERLAGGGVRYTGSDTTRIYCFPSCRHARRTRPDHEVTFRSAEDALSAGYRPCRVCRPLTATPFAA